MFNRLITLIGEDKFKKIEEIKVLIVGLGGVGGYALEAIVRSGIKNIFIVDNDIIHISNLNRQIITSIDNIGKSKAEIAAARALSINPLINLTALSLFLNKENIDQIINEDFNYVIDACDSVNTKLLLIEYSLKLNYKLISCLGTANKTNPALFTITELTKTSNDPLARILRKRIKELKINKKIMVVSSTETPIKREGLGTNSFIPGIAGLLCASYVINDVTKKIN